MTESIPHSDPIGAGTLIDPTTGQPVTLNYTDEAGVPLSVTFDVPSNWSTFVAREVTAAAYAGSAGAGQGVSFLYQNARNGGMADLQRPDGITSPNWTFIDDYRLA